MKEVYTTLLHQTSSCVCVCVYVYVCVCLCVCVCARSVAQSYPTLWDPWAVACQIPLCMEFSRQEYWSGLHFLLQTIFVTQESSPCLMSLALAGRFFTTESPGKLQRSPYFLPNELTLRKMSYLKNFSSSDHKLFYWLKSISASHIFKDNLSTMHSL